jgi:hypothetical protein
MRLGRRIVDGGQFEILWSSEKPIRPEPYSGSRSVAAWNSYRSQVVSLKGVPLLRPRKTGYRPIRSGGLMEPAVAVS